MSADGISNRPTAIIRFKTSPIDAHFRREAHSLGIFLEKSEVFSNFATLKRFIDSGKDMERHLISNTSTIYDALERMNQLSGSERTLLVVNAERRMVGTLTDGDIRRGLLRRVGLDAPVTEVMHRNFRCLRGQQPDLFLMKDARRKGITLLPHLDDEGRVTRLYDLTVCKSVLPLTAILMAGGRGERLRPLTLSTPKPLLKIGDKAIIDYNVEALARVGITDISVTVNYLAEQIEAHFADHGDGMNIRCVREPRYLGTIGSARLCDLDDNGTSLIMNSDILTTISYEEMYLKHVATDADMTVATVPYIVSVPFGVLETEGDAIRSVKEKPTFTYYSNAGIYIVKNKLLKSIPDDEPFDATDLIEQAINEGRQVVYYPIDGTWIDIGSPDDFRKAQQLMRHFNDINRNY